QVFGPAAARNSRAWRLDFRRRTAAALFHELIEFLFVLRHAQPAKELLKLALLLFKPPQGLGPIIVESLVARARRPPPCSGIAYFVHAARPPAHTSTFPRRTHASAPDQKGQNRKSDRPPVDEAQDRERDPGRLSQIIKLCNQSRHCWPHL